MKNPHITVTKRRLKLTITTTRRTLVPHIRPGAECEPELPDLSQPHGGESLVIGAVPSLDALIGQLDTRLNKL